MLAATPLGSGRDRALKVPLGLLGTQEDGETSRHSLSPSYNGLGAKTDNTLLGATNIHIIPLALKC